MTRLRTIASSRWTSVRPILPKQYSWRAAGLPIRSSKTSTFGLSKEISWQANNASVTSEAILLLRRAQTLQTGAYLRFVWDRFLVSTVERAFRSQTKWFFRTNIRQTCPSRNSSVHPMAKTTSSWNNNPTAVCRACKIAKLRSEWIPRKSTANKVRILMRRKKSLIKIYKRSWRTAITNYQSTT